MTTNTQPAEGGSTIRPLPIRPPWPWPGPCFPPRPTDRTATDAPWTGDVVEVMRHVYLRPDVRALIIGITPVFADLLSRNEAAAQALDQLAGGLSPAPDSERLAPLVGYLLIAAAGAAVGYLSRP